MFRYLALLVGMKSLHDSKCTVMAKQTGPTDHPVRSRWSHGRHGAKTWRTSIDRAWTTCRH